MNTVEKHNYLNDDIYSGRKGHTAIDPVVITTMTREKFHLQHVNAAAMDRNAAACFDRMIVGPTSITEMNAGTPTKVSTAFARILQQMEYHMCTQKGISEGFSKNSKDKPIHRTGQGATNSPPKLILNDNLIAKAYGKKAKGCIMHDPTQQLIKKQYSFRYLWVSGGLLETNKTKYVLTIWKFGPNGRPVLLAEEKLPVNNIDIVDVLEHTMRMERVPVEKGVRMLGVRQAGSLQMNSKFDIQLAKTVKVSLAIVACPLKRHEVFLGYRTVYIPSLTYGFAATSFTEKQHDKLIVTLNPRLLPRL
eukprot:5190977-Ditylum_brightwellii.AAC.1